MPGHKTKLVQPTAQRVLSSSIQVNHSMLNLTSKVNNSDRFATMQWSTGKLPVLAWCGRFFNRYHPHKRPPGSTMSYYGLRNNQKPKTNPASMSSWESPSFQVKSETAPVTLDRNKWQLTGDGWMKDG